MYIIYNWNIVKLILLGYQSREMFSMMLKKSFQEFKPMTISNFGQRSEDIQKQFMSLGSLGLL